MLNGMKRLPVLAVVIGALLLTGCDSSSGEASAPPPPPPATATAFESCPDAAKQGGGHDVWVQGMECSEVTTNLLISMPDAFGRYKSLPESKRQVSTEGEDGWVCWSALESDFGPIHNVCRRDEATLIFYEG